MDLKCTKPGLVTADQLFAVAIGEQVEPARSHVEQCPVCAAVVAAYEREDRALRTRLLRHCCPSSLAMGELALGMLETTEALELRAHLVDCRFCAEEMRRLGADLVRRPQGGSTAGTRPSAAVSRAPAPHARPWPDAGRAAWGDACRGTQLPGRRHHGVAQRASRGSRGIAVVDIARFGRRGWVSPRRQMRRARDCKRQPRGQRRGRRVRQLPCSRTWHPASTTWSFDSSTRCSRSRE